MQKPDAISMNLAALLILAGCTGNVDNPFKVEAQDECGAWIGVIGLQSAEGGFHDLVEETRTIPLVLPPDDHSQQWGFAIACDDDQPCSVSYALYAPLENWGKETREVADFERTITTPPGGVVRPFGFDPGDYFGTYRLVVGLEGRTVCDVTVHVVE